MKSNWLPEIVQRSENGPFQKESEYDLTLAKTIMGLVQDYEVKYDSQTRFLMMMIWRIVFIRLQLTWCWKQEFIINPLSGGFYLPGRKSKKLWLLRQPS